MSSAKHNIIIEQGATFSDALIVNQPGLPTTPMDLTGYDARMMIRVDYADVVPIIALDLTNQRLKITTPASGRIDRLISATDTALFTFESAVYDLEIQSPDGTVTRLVQGRVALSKNVTK